MVEACETGFLGLMQIVLVRRCCRIVADLGQPKFEEAAGGKRTVVLRYPPSFFYVPPEISD